MTAFFLPHTACRIGRDLEEHALAHVDVLGEVGQPDPEGVAVEAGMRDVAVMNHMDIEITLAAETHEYPALVPVAIRAQAQPA
ncbi:hypothetical protein ACFSC4_29270 [Deinococcus malanensis]|nr:hypothetical protein [Deinococcus malanensis]